MIGNVIEKLRKRKNYIGICGTQACMFWAHCHNMLFVLYLITAVTMVNYIDGGLEGCATIGPAQWRGCENTIGSG